MTASLILYGLVTGSLVAGGAWAADRVCRIAGFPTRFSWIAGLVLAVVLVAVAPLRPSPLPPPVTRSGLATVASVAPPVLAAARGIPDWIDPYLAGAWIGASVLTATAFLL